MIVAEIVAELIVAGPDHLSESSQIEIQFTMSCRGGGIVSFHSMPIYATIHHSKIGEGISLCKYAFVPCEIRDAGWDSVCTCTCLQ